MTAHMWWSSGWGVVGGLLTAAFWVLIILLVIGLVRSGKGGVPGSRSGALRILEERYARGDIDRDEFLEGRRVLLGGGEPAEPGGGSTR